ncbi:MAG: LysM peptidoglycan-binding domain-containing protein, partial [Chloroflexota bacterium]
NPIALATAGPDGSIVHEVQEGQTLWTIAAYYKADINELLRINGLYSGSFIKPGQEIIIQEAGQAPAADAAASGPAAAGTLTAQPTRTPRPTRTPTLPALAAAGGTSQVDAAPAAAALQPAAGQAPRSLAPTLLLGLIGLLVVGGTLLLLAGNLLKRAE